MLKIVNCGLPILLASARRHHGFLQYFVKNQDLYKILKCDKCLRRKLKVIYLMFFLAIGFVAHLPMRFDAARRWQDSEVRWTIARRAQRTRYVRWQDDGEDARVRCFRRPTVRRPSPHAPETILYSPDPAPPHSRRPAQYSSCARDR